MTWVTTEATSDVNKTFLSLYLLTNISIRAQICHLSNLKIGNTVKYLSKSTLNTCFIILLLWLSGSHF